VDAAPGEVNQYLIRAQQGSIDLSKVGTIHSDLGYSVGVTWASGTEIGFRYEPFETDSKTRPESELRITAPAK
jgi:hypothetical protein